MFLPRPSGPRDRRPAFTMIEVMVVLAIIALLIGLLVPAVQKVREMAARTQCCNNLMQLGIAFNRYQDDHRFFPAEGMSAFAEQNTSFYTEILPYIEQGNQKPENNVNPTNIVTIKIFHCPANPRPGTGPQDDYCACDQSSFANPPLNNGTYHSILGGHIRVNLNAVSSGAGASYTLLLAHKSLRGGGFTDTNWADGTMVSLDHLRMADGLGTGSSAKHGYVLDDGSADSNYMAGPHSLGSPVLWADASVRYYPYTYTDPNLKDDCFTWQLFWAYNRTQTVVPPN